MLTLLFSYISSQDICFDGASFDCIIVFFFDPGKSDRKITSFDFRAILPDTLRKLSSKHGKLNPSVLNSDAFGSMFMMKPHNKLVVEVVVRLRNAKKCYHCTDCNLMTKRPLKFERLGGICRILSSMTLSNFVHHLGFIMPIDILGHQTLR